MWSSPKSEKKAVAALAELETDGITVIPIPDFEESLRTARFA